MKQTFTHYSQPLLNSQPYGTMRVMVKTQVKWYQFSITSFRIEVRIKVIQLYISTNYI